VALPWSPDGTVGVYEAWARVATLMAGVNRGSWFIPDVSDEVLLIFVAGDVRHPVVIGGLWNGVDTPPVQMDGNGKNYVKAIRSRNGVKVTLDDQDGQEQMILETPGGQKVTLKDGPGLIELLDSSGNSVKLESAGITVTTAAKLTVNATGAVDISAATVSVNAATATFSGVVQATTVIATTVMGTTYTPGAGNIW
jgi:uncharacterized protein involved in type VI secretion and phage assembly